MICKMVKPSFARRLFNGDLFDAGYYDTWPPNIESYFAICTGDDIVTILCGGGPQRNVFGHYDGTNGAHIRAAINEIRQRERNKR